MKPMRLIFVLLAALAIMAAGVSAEEKAAKTEAKEMKSQTRCPVMGGKIDSTEYTDIQGQRVYHCCAGCSEKLVADPDKYFQKAAAQGVVFENIQTACPVTGKEHSHKIMTNYDGRVVYFASEEAKKEFAKDPDKYLKVLDGQVKAKKPAESKEPAHSHGSH